MLRKNETELMLSGVPDDISKFEGRYKALPGRTVALADIERDTSNGGILLADKLRGNLRPDICTVLDAGEGVPLKKGERIVVRPYDGSWVKEGSSQIRFYGVVSNGQTQKSELIPWDESIVGRIEGNEFVPVGQNMVVRFEQVSTDVLLVNELRQDVVVVVHPGDTRFAAGDRLIVKEPYEGAFLRFSFDNGKYKGCHLIPREAVLDCHA